MKNNLKHGIKTTLLGVFLILLSVTYMFFSLDKEIDLNLWIFAGTLGSGGSLLIVPDDFIAKLKSILKNFKISGKNSDS